MQRRVQEVRMRLEFLLGSAAQQFGRNVLVFGDFGHPFRVLLLGRGVVDLLAQRRVRFLEFVDFALSGVLHLVEFHGLGLELVVVLVLAALLGQSLLDDLVDLFLGERPRLTAVATVIGTALVATAVDETDVCRESESDGHAALLCCFPWIRVRPRHGALYGPPTRYGAWSPPT